MRLRQPERDIGDLRQRVVIETPRLILGPTLVMQRTWVAVQTVWAKITPLDPDALQFGPQTTPTATHDVWMRFGAPVSLLSRLRDREGRLYMVVTLVDLEERHQWLKIRAMLEQAGATYTT